MRQILKRLLIIILLAFSLPNQGIYSQMNSQHSMVLKDETLIAPGIGAASVVIDMPEDEVLLIKGRPVERTKHVAHDFFKDVFTIQSEIQLPFNYLYIYRNPSTFIGFNNNKVSFVVVWDSHGVLIDGVRVSKGIMTLLFNYGNEGMKVIRDEQGAIYIYVSKGIAFIDEKNDDLVDGIIIFKAVSSK